MSKKIDLTGHKFGRLTVIKQDLNSKRTKGFTLNEISNKYNIKKVTVKSRYYLLKNKGEEITIDKILNYANQLPLNKETY